MLDEVHIGTKDIFVFSQTAVDENNKVQGSFGPVGNVPTFFDDVQKRGISLPKDIFSK